MFPISIVRLQNAVVAAASSLFVAAVFVMAAVGPAANAPIL